jgi:RNA polymerase sigma-70 factor, ECF subfamily
MGPPNPDSAHTQALLARAQAGDRQAFEELFARYRAYLRQVVELRLDAPLRARVDPSDVVQETQVEVFQRLADYLARRPMPFRLWLRKTAQERLLKVRRHHLETARRAVGREIALPDHSSLLLAQQLAAGVLSPSQQFGQAEVARRVRQAVALLAEADQEVLLMRHFEGLSNQEIGQVLDLDAGAVSKRHGRALIRLQQLLAEGGVTESQL